SWSDMDDEEEMDFSKPIEFEQIQQQQQHEAIDFLTQSGFPTLTELVSAMALPSSASAIEVQ
ncbi:hypothetical protein BGX26_005560, partial [Mortierella sp. AD094]